MRNRVAFLLYLIFIFLTITTRLEAKNDLFRVSVLYDSSATKGVAVISSVLESNRPAFIPSENIQGLFSPHGTYWLYFEPQAASSTQQYVLSFSQRLSLVEVYPYPFEGISGLGGTLVKRSSKALSGNSVFLPPGTHGYLVKVQNSLWSNTSIRNLSIKTDVSYFREQGISIFLQGLAQGTFILMILVNLLLFIIIRQMLQFYYVLYILTNSLFLLFSFNYSECLLFPNHPLLNLSLLSFQMLGVFFYSTFLRQLFLRFCTTYTKAIDRKVFLPFCHLILLVNVGLGSTIFYRIDLFAKYAGLVNVLEALAAIVSFIYFRKGFTLYLNITVIGSLFMIVGGILSVTDLLHIYPDMLLYEVGVLVELLLFSYMMGLLHVRTIRKRYEAELAKKVVQEELELKNRELVFQAIQLSAKDEVIASIKSKIKDYRQTDPEKNAKLTNIESEIFNYTSNSVWKDFELHFNSTHPGFYSRLVNQYPQLSQSEIKLCALIKLNLNTKEIASITQKTPRSIEVMRSRIRQKMNVARDGNLTQALAQLDE